MKNNNPCYKCEERWVKEVDGKLTRCHSVCERYIAWETARADELKEIARLRKLNRDISAVEQARRKRTKQL